MGIKCNVQWLKLHKEGYKIIFNALMVQATYSKKSKATSFVLHACFVLMFPSASDDQHQEWMWVSLRPKGSALNYLWATPDEMCCGGSNKVWVSHRMSEELSEEDSLICTAALFVYKGKGQDLV